MTIPGTKPLVLHLAVDYPNAYRPDNTLAVRNFVNANRDIDHLVFALTRTANPLRVARVAGDGNGDQRVMSMRYWGLPFGLLLALSMLIVAFRIKREIARRGLKPSLVHAHKLSFEGIAGWFLSRHMHIPLVLSVRGEAESKILRFKPHYHPLLKRVLSDAIRIYYVSAWFRPLLNRRFRISQHKQKLLPNFVSDPKSLANTSPQVDRLVTVLDLNVYRKKGLDRLLPAFRECLRQFPDAHLDVIGRGEATSIAEVRQLLEKLGLRDNVSLVGSMGNTALLERLPLYAGLVLPSHNETFGMVYVEALLAGIPILHSKGTGIDGFVDFIEARVAVNPTDQASIAQGLCQLLDQQAVYRQWLRSNRAKVASEFNSANYVKDYTYLATHGKFAKAAQ